jgi:hypothetical protein
MREEYENGFPGWVPDFEKIEEYVGSLQFPNFALAAPELMQSAEKIDAFHWLQLMSLFPEWVRGAQGIGDCVGWGWSLGGHILACNEGTSPPVAQFSTEATYGGSRVEARGGSLGGYGDGSYGAAASKFSVNYGFLPRQDFREAADGNEEADLRVYSSAKAKAWGNYGCGGKKDERGAGPMDRIAKLHPILDSVLVRTVEEATKALESFKPIVICSNVGFGNGVRNTDGIVRAKGNWNHCMLVAGVKHTDKYGPLQRIINSWGKSASGPDPDVKPEHSAISDCSWWAVPEDMERIYRQGDSFAIRGITPWNRRKIPHIVL